jgi:hypothetical protein
MRRLLAWLVALPLAAAGTYLTHSLLPVRAHPAGGHAHPTTDTGLLGFLCSAPFLLSTIGLLALLVAIRVVQTRSTSVSAWPFALLVPLGFLLHHHLEHFVGGAPAPLGALVGSELLVGLALQLPFALLAYLVVTALLRVADRLIAALSARRRRLVAPAAIPPGRISVSTPRIALLATAAAPRAPPLGA